MKLKNYGDPDRMEQERAERKQEKKCKKTKKQKTKRRDVIEQKNKT